MILSALLSFLFLHAIEALENVANCDWYSRDGVDCYSRYGPEDSLVKDCAGEPAWIFSKGDGEMAEDSLEAFCKKGGFDTVGQIWTALEEDLENKRAEIEPMQINICNVKFEYPWSPIMNAREPFTWQCVDYSNEAIECCEGFWWGDCYSRRGDYNNYDACYTFENGACQDVCGGGNQADNWYWWGSSEDSAECAECCREKQTRWNCPKEEESTITKEAASELCKKATDKSSCKKAVEKKVGKCKYRQKKGKCYLRHYYGSTCDDLKGSTCKKAYKGGMCDSDDKGKTCKEFGN